MALSGENPEDWSWLDEVEEQYMKLKDNTTGMGLGQDNQKKQMTRKDKQYGLLTGGTLSNNLCQLCQI